MAMRSRNPRRSRIAESLFHAQAVHAGSIQAGRLGSVQVFGVGRENLGRGRFKQSGQNGQRLVALTAGRHGQLAGSGLGGLGLFRGLPCPNLFTGGANFHGRYEYLPIPSLVKACETVIEIAKRAAQHS